MSNSAQCAILIRMTDWQNEIMVGDFIQLAEDGEYLPVQRVLWNGVQAMIPRDDFPTIFATFEEIFAVVPNDEYRAMLDEGWA